MKIKNNRISSMNSLYSLCKLCSVGIGGSVLSILTQFLSNRSRHVIVGGCRSKLVFVVGLLLFYTSKLFSILQENKPIGYANESTLMAVKSSPCVRVTIAESLKRDLDKSE